MALTSAARRFGISVVDVQHGVQGHFHIGYGQWSRLMSENASLIPTQFWVWGKSERDAIKGGLASEGDIVVGGNLYLALIEEGRLHLEGEEVLKTKIGEIGLGDRPQVLVTLQRGWERAELISELFKIIGKSPYFWWIRLHPNGMVSASEVEEQIAANGGTNFNVREATSLPLALLLRNCRAHVTYHSTVVIEARESGVPSLILGGELGSQMYSQVIEEGVAKCYTHENSLISQIDSLIGSVKLDHNTPVSILGTEGIEYLVRHLPGTTIE